MPSRMYGRASAQVCKAPERISPDPVLYALGVALRCARSLIRGGQRLATGAAQPFLLPIACLSAREAKSLHAPIR